MSSRAVCALAKNTSFLHTPHMLGVLTNMCPLCCPLGWHVAHARRTARTDPNPASSMLFGLITHSYAPALPAAAPLTVHNLAPWRSHPTTHMLLAASGGLCMLHVPTTCLRARTMVTPAVTQPIAISLTRRCQVGALAAPQYQVPPLP
jgi:hypothetical protein